MSSYQQQLCSVATTLRFILIEKKNRIKSLNDDQNVVVEYFGGIDVMLYLCLSNPNCNEFLSQESVPSLKSLLKIDEMDIKRDRESSILIVESRSGPSNIATNDCHGTVSSSINSASNGTTSTVFYNLIDFYTHSMIIITDKYDNFYHKSLHLSLEHTRFILDKIWFSKCFFMCSVIMWGMLYSLSQIYWNITHDSGWIYLGMFVLAQSIGVVLVLLYILSANVDIVSLLIQTFDFWYKMYNMIIAVVSTSYLDYYVSWVHLLLDTLHWYHLQC